MTLFLHRRGLIGAFCAFGAAHAAADEFRCEGLAAPPAVSLTAAEAERHQMLLLLSMALVFAAWSVGPDASLRDDYARAVPGYVPRDHGGHNVGALLVDREAILGFALNRNIALRSTLEHAEARAVRLAFRRAEPALQATGNRFAYSSLLRGATLYATLEPCSQCAGILDLANVPLLVYGQRDPGQRCIANIVHNLHSGRGSGPGPLPVRADFLSFAAELDAAYADFLQRRSGGGPMGVTAFLETVAAFRIFTRAAAAFADFEPVHDQNRPLLSSARSFFTDWHGHLGAGLAPDS